MNKQSYGLYTMSEVTPTEQLLDKSSSLNLDFVVPLELFSHWKKCSLVSDFFANYQSEHYKNDNKIKNILSSIINELLENAVKFSDDKNKLVNISLKQFKNTITIETVNISNKKNAQVLDKYINTLNTVDLETLFLQQIEYSSTENKQFSGIGLLSIIKDYDAKLGLKIIPKPNSENAEIFVKVSLNKNTLKKL